MARMEDTTPSGQPSRATCCAAPHPRGQPPDQGHVTLLADLAAQPQARRDQHGQRHPHDPALFLDAQLIGLDLSEVTRLLNQIRVPDLALTARPGPPICAGALVEAKRGHDRLHGTPMGEHGHDEDDSLCGGAQLIEDRA